MTLNVSVGGSSQEEFLCEDNNPCLVDDKIKSVVPETGPLERIQLINKLHSLKR